MKYLVIEVGYNHLALPYSSPAELATLVGMIEASRPVDSKGYGADQKWVPTKDEPPEMLFVSGARVTIGNDIETLQARLAQVEAESKSNHDSFMRYYGEADKLKKRVKELETPAAAAAPTPEPVAATTEDDQPF